MMTELKNKISEWTRILISAILLVVITYFMPILKNHFVEYFYGDRIATSDSTFIDIIFIIVLPVLIYILIVAILNKGKSIQNSIIIGVKIGIIAVIIFAIFMMKATSSFESFEMSMCFSVVFIFCSVIGVMIAYFIRKYIKNKKDKDVMEK